MPAPAVQPAPPPPASPPERPAKPIDLMAEFKAMSYLDSE
jgi:hypothetical protein